MRPQSGTKKGRSAQSTDDVSKHMKKMIAELDERNVSVRCNRVLNKIKRV